MKGTEQKNQDTVAKILKATMAKLEFSRLLFPVISLLFSSLLDRREILVEIERKRVEFFTSCVTFERSKLVPPMLSSVFPYRRIFLVQCVVQEEGNAASNKRL